MHREHKVKRENQQDATNSMFIIKLSISTCFGHHYAHHQENKTLSYCMRCSAWVCRLWLAVVLWSCVVSCVHCWFSLFTFVDLIFRAVVTDHPTLNCRVDSAFIFISLFMLSFFPFPIRTLEYFIYETVNVSGPLFVTSWRFPKLTKFHIPMNR